MSSFDSGRNINVHEQHAIAVVKQMLDRCYAPCAWFLKPFKEASWSIFAVPTLMAGIFVCLLTLWLFSVVDLSLSEGCGTRSVNESEYQELRKGAEAQNWTVWPGLSNGIFWPSDRGFKPPAPVFERRLGDRLFGFIAQLAGNEASANKQLAAAHAVMRAMHAEYVSVHEIPDFKQNGIHASSSVQFKYFLPQLRFAPLCLPCLFWWETTVTVSFRHDLAAGAYAFTGVNVLNSDLKYTPS